MTNKRFRLLFLGLAFTASTGSVYAQTGKSFKVEGHIDHLPDQELYITWGPFSQSSIDTVITHNGSFTFTGKLDEPTMAMIFSKDYHVKLDLYVDNNPIQVEGDLDNASEIKVEGKGIVQAFNDFNQGIIENRQRIFPVAEQLQKARAAGDTAQVKALEETYKDIYYAEKQLRKDYIRKHPDSYISIRELYGLTDGPNLAESRKLFTTLTPRIQQSIQGREVAERIALLSKIENGRQALDFTQLDVNDNAVKLSDFRGQYVLLDFWASWCGPCRAENPNVLKAYKQYKDKGFTVLAVSLDKQKDKWVEAIKQDGMPWTQVSDLKGWKNEVAEKYGIHAVPTNFLIDPQGRIVAQNLRGEALEQKLAEILN